MKPMARRQPYSQTFCLMFWVVEIRSKKKAKVRAIIPTRPTKSSNRRREFETAFIATFLSSKTVLSSLKNDLMSFAN